MIEKTGQATTQANLSNTKAPVNNIQIQASNLLQTLKVGQLLNINVLKSLGNQIQFTVGNQAQTYLASTPNQLPENAQLQVLVKQTQPSLVLQIANSTQNQAAKNEQLIQNIIRQLLPNQQPSTQLIQSIVADQRNLPPAIQSLISQTIERLFRPQAENLTGKQLKALIQNSGLFFENNLDKTAKNTPSPSPQQDLKANLFQILFVAKQEGKTELAEKIQKLLNKITLQQVQSLHQGFLSLEIPMQPNPTLKEIKLDIRKDKNEQGTSWEVLIDCELEVENQRHQLSSKLVFQQKIEQDQLSIFFWTEQTELKTLLAENLENLRQKLRDSQLPIQQIQISQVPLTGNPTMKQFSLIDIKV